MNLDLKKITDSTFQCSTELEAKQLLEFLHNKGFRWAGGNSLLEDTRWGEYKQDTRYITDCYKFVRYNNKQNEGEIICRKLMK